MANQLKIFQEFLTADSSRVKYPAPMGAAESVNLYFETNGQNSYLRSVEGLRTKLQKDGTGEYQLLYVSSVGEEQYSFRPSLFAVRNGNLYRYNHNLSEELLVEGIVVNGGEIHVSETGGENPALLIVNGTDTLFMVRLKQDNAPVIRIPLPKKISSDTDKIMASDIAVVSGSIVVLDKDTSFVYYSVAYPLSNEKRQVLRIEGGKVMYKEDGISPLYAMVTPDGRYAYDDETGEMGEKLDSYNTVYSYAFLDDYGNRQYFSAESSSDVVNGLYTLGNLLVLFGTNSIEFYNRGDAESYRTWQRVSFTNYKEHGLHDRRTMASVKGNIYYVGRSDFSTLSVNRVNGTAVEKVSPVWLDELLEASTCGYGFCFGVNGHDLYALELETPDGSRTVVYDASTGLWHFRVSRRPDSSKLYKWAARFVCRFENKLICASNRYNSLFELDRDYFCEDTDGEPIPLYRSRTSPMLVSDYKPFIFAQMNIEGSVGTANRYQRKDDVWQGGRLVSGAPFNPRIFLEISNDGGYTWGNTYENRFGVSGDYSFRCIWNNMGMFRQCVIKIIYTEDTPFILSAISMNVRGTVACI